MFETVFLQMGAVSGLKRLNVYISCQLQSKGCAFPSSIRMLTVH